MLAATADPKDPLKNDKTCEAEYFIAVTKAAAGKPAEAQEAYQRAIATKSRQLSAFRGAQFALKKTNAAAGSPASVAIPTTGGKPAANTITPTNAAK